MDVLFSVSIIIVCVLLILIVLVQNSKGGGLASNFASSNQFMGVRKTADFLEKATWTLAGTLLFLCLLSSIAIKNKESAPKSAIEDAVKNTPSNPGQPINFNSNSSGNKSTESKTTPEKTTTTPPDKEKK